MGCIYRLTNLPKIIPKITLFGVILLNHKKSKNNFASVRFFLIPLVITLKTT